MTPCTSTHDSGGDGDVNMVDGVVCMVCDFYLPNLGGVEAHIHNIALNLSAQGTKVVIVTHEYGEHKGVVRSSEHLVTYYLPLPVMWRENTYPTVIGAFAILRRLFLFEGVTIVHGHSAFSTLCHEALLCASLMGLRTVYTDHSLLEMEDISNRIVAKILAFTLSHTDHAICVSHTCREHLVCNTSVSPQRTSVIPNAVDAVHFRPIDADPRPCPTVVVVSRLYWRKGIDLLARVIPRVCSRHPTASFLVGGDGPMRIHLEEMRDTHNLAGRVELLGSVPHADVPSVLARGSIFLNCSRTESFCMAILEAACCGLHVVSTNVGGVPEVLPPSMCDLCDPCPDALADAVLEALRRSQRRDPHVQHRQLREMYAWPNVTARTHRVYRDLGQQPHEQRSHQSVFDLIRSWRRHGLVWTMVFVTMFTVARMWLDVLRVIQPSHRYTTATSTGKHHQKMKET